MQSAWEKHGHDRHRHDRPVTGKYMELLSFVMEVLDILQTKTFKLIEEEKVPIVKNWLRTEGLQ